MREFIGTAGAATFGLDIVSAEGLIYAGEARMVALPSASGELGILPNHSPLLALLQPGEARILTPEGEVEYLYISGGHAEVQPFAVMVLADTVIRGEDVDRDAALEAKAQAEKIIQTARLYSDRDRAQVELLKALAQLRALEHAKRKKRGTG